MLLHPQKRKESYQYYIFLNKISNICIGKLEFFRNFAAKLEYERHDAYNSLSVPVYNTLAYEFDNAAMVYRAATPWNSPRSILQQALKQLEDADAQRQSKS